MADMSGSVFPDAAQYRRDFEWLVSCPSLLNFPEALSTEFLDGDRMLDFGPVESFFDSKAAFRVGYYTEALLDVWLGHAGQLEEVQRSIQVQDGNRTLGELDFLYRVAGRLHHLEVALKFYLHCPETNETGSHFVGPNSADTFEKKRDRFFNHQLPLGKERFPEVDVSEIIMKGMIFYPPGVDDSVSLPEGLNPDHRRGRWIRETELGWLEENSGASGGFLLDKPFWLSGVPFSESLPQLSRAIRQHFEKRRHPVFVTLKDGEGRELERVFVVPDEWPTKS